MKVGYERVSTKEQSTLRQDVIMQHMGVEKLYIEKVSGKDRNRPELQKMLAFVRQGDTVIIESMSRLARNTKDFLNIMEQLQNKGVGIVSQKENIDTATPTGRFLVTVLASLAQLERDTTKQRQKEGIEAQKAAGIYTGGRPKAQIDKRQLEKVCKEWTDGNITAVEAARRLNVSKSTFYKVVKQVNDNNNG